MSRTVTLSVIVALVAAGLMLAGAWVALRPGGPPLVSAGIAGGPLTPNADGDGDDVTVQYTLRRPARLSIYFTNAAGQTFVFRDQEPREAGEYMLNFGGVVDAFALPSDDQPEGSTSEVTRRVLPNGEYTWTIEATDGAGSRNEFTGSLTVGEADTAIPWLDLEVSPLTFTPNQDGIGDRVEFNLWLDKEVPEGGLKLFLIGPEGTQLPIAEAPSGLRPGERGLHKYNYDAGIDQNLEPPSDGAYIARAEVEDAIGQRVVVETELKIEFGGLPQAQIFRGEVEFSSSSVISGNVLYFSLVVENYGTAPLRTTGPESGYIYESMSLNANALGEYEEDGAWRIGINCQTCIGDYPWRWALGTHDELALIPDENGNPQYYLMPGQMVEVSGGVILDNVIPSRNPQYFWAGLIHENVGVINNRVDQEFVEILAP